MRRPAVTALLALLVAVPVARGPASATGPAPVAHESAAVAVAEAGTAGRPGHVAVVVSDMRWGSSGSAPSESLLVEYEALTADAGGGTRRELGWATVPRSDVVVTGQLRAVRLAPVAVEVTSQGCDELGYSRCTRDPRPRTVTVAAQWRALDAAPVRRDVSASPGPCGADVLVAAWWDRDATARLVVDGAEVAAHGRLSGNTRLSRSC